MPADPSAVALIFEKLLFTRFITRFIPRFQIPGSLDFQWCPMDFPRILRSPSSRNPRFPVRLAAPRNTRFLPGSLPGFCLVHYPVFYRRAHNPCKQQALARRDFRTFSIESGNRIASALANRPKCRPIVLISLGGAKRCRKMGFGHAKYSDSLENAESWPPVLN